jgi:hypothetical protein
MENNVNLLDSITYKFIAKIYKYFFFQVSFYQMEKGSEGMTWLS